MLNIALAKSNCVKENQSIPISANSYKLNVMKVLNYRVRLIAHLVWQPKNKDIT